jgi:hypothetical protein
MVVIAAMVNGDGAPQCIENVESMKNGGLHPEASAQQPAMKRKGPLAR